MRIDLRERCERCGKLKPEPRGPITKARAEEFEKYAPYCSYHCQEWARLEWRWSPEHHGGILR